MLTLTSFCDQVHCINGHRLQFGIENNLKYGNIEFKWKKDEKTTKAKQNKFKHFENRISFLYSISSGSPEHSFKHEPEPI